MSYRCGTGGLRGLGIPDSQPRIICDGCQAEYEIPRRGACGAPPSWFLDGKAPPGWKRNKKSEDRKDWCPGCKEKL